uniref:capsid assembly scaffolding protein Gp46 family protein n=2 Tax=Bacteria TaxID=2 RepID=UPI003FA6A2E1
MKKRLFMPVNLQFFSEPGDGGSGDGGQQENPPAGSQETPPKAKEENTAGKTFSRDEVAKMIAAETNKAKAAWEKELEAKKEEAKKLAKMNAEEKLQHELEQKEAEIAELK